MHGRVYGAERCRSETEVAHPETKEARRPHDMTKVLAEVAGSVQHLRSLPEQTSEISRGGRRRSLCPS